MDSGHLVGQFLEYLVVSHGVGGVMREQVNLTKFTESVQCQYSSSHFHHSPITCEISILSALVLYCVCLLFGCT